jgi:photosystem II biogenesis protein Psp29
MGLHYFHIIFRVAVNIVRTVSDTKRAFYTTHTRPVNSIYRRVVEEFMVEMHLLSVNADFHYDDIYALGMVTAFDRFMQGYRPEQSKAQIFDALCQASGQDPQQYRQSAEKLRAQAVGFSINDLTCQIESLSRTEGHGIQAELRRIAENPRFKYSRLFAIGLYSFLEIIDPELVKDEKKRDEILGTICSALNLSPEKVQKDLELYRSNLDKITQAQIVMEDILKADRKKKAEREQAKNTISTPSTPSEES